MKMISDAIVASELELIKKQKQTRVGSRNKQDKAKGKAKDKAKQATAKPGKPQRKRVAGRPTPT